MTTRLLIADRSLRDERGHHYSLTHTITQGARRSGLDVTWFVNREFQTSLEPEGVTVRRVFSASMYGATATPVIAFFKIRTSRSNGEVLLYLLNRIRASLAYRWARYRRRRPHAEADIARNRSAHISLAEELSDAMSAEQLGPTDHVLIHSADGDLYRAVLNVVLATPRNQLPVIHIATPYDTGTMPNHDRTVSVDRIVRYLRLVRLLGTRIFLYGENVSLAEHLAREWGEPVSPLEIPPPDEASLPQAVANSDGSLHVVYLGAAREEKGFLALPGVVTRCVEAKAGVTVSFTIQCTKQVVGYTKPIRAAIEQLAAFDPEFVTLIRSEQPMKEYYALLDSADVVLACYDPDNYRFRGSGVAVEAVAFGNSVIVTPGTSPQVIAAEAGVPATGAEEIAAAILEIAARKSDYARRAEARRTRYLAENTAEKYVRHLLSASDQASEEDGGAAIEAAGDSVDDRPDRPGQATDWRAALAAELHPAREAGDQPVNRKLIGRSPVLTRFGLKKK